MNERDHTEVIHAHHDLRLTIRLSELKETQVRSLLQIKVTVKWFRVALRTMPELRQRNCDSSPRIRVETITAILVRLPETDWRDAATSQSLSPTARQ